jgi:DNA-binding transcriptional LysR family regulator
MARRNVGRAALDQASILSLRIFCTVAEARSFSAAARQLRLSPSVVTNHVLSLERAIRVALFHRTTRRVAVTTAGERFYRRCSVILREIEQSLDAVAPERDQRAHLRVTAPPLLRLHCLVPIFPSFLAVTQISPSILW